MLGRLCCCCLLLGTILQLGMLADVPSCAALQGVGVNWGTQASHPLLPSVVVQMLQANNISKVKLFDANRTILNALAHSGIDVMVGIPNDLLNSMTNQTLAMEWVQDNVLPYLHKDGVRIRYVAVGNEPFLRSYNSSFLNTTYPALVNVQKALNAVYLGEEIKATVPMNADVIEPGEVPSESVFRPDINGLMTDIVDWLNTNGAPFTINIYPFISLYNQKDFPVDFAFFDGTSNPIKDGPYTYENVFDASYDSLVAALVAAGPYGEMNITVGEIGWPADGDINANISYAQKFNEGLLKHVLSNEGTPRRPGITIDFYLFSLIDEDMKSIAPGNFERHWGVFSYDGRPKYALSMAGIKGGLVGASGVQYMEKQWCAYNPDGTNQAKLGDSITYACTNSDCTSLNYGCSCNPFLDMDGNTSYAFNQYYQRQNQRQDACNFNGLGKVVKKDPSVQQCEFMVQIAYPSYASSPEDAAQPNSWLSLHQISIIVLTHFLALFILL